MVILVNGVKHACVSCIRGHRVKKCNHNDRPLIPIVKRGRQVSQCNHCRDLRQTNKSHVKCTCAIASTPNPINGCLCEVILTCTCVAGHLQEVQEDGSSAYSGSPSTYSQPSPKSIDNKEEPKSLPPSTCCNKGNDNTTKTITNALFEDQPSSDQQIPVATNHIFSPINADESDLLNFLENDLDKYISHPSS